MTTEIETDSVRTAVLIAGPTASGKSALARALARRVNGVIVNADSMQVYRELRILTARPSAEEEAALPHRLYGLVSAREAYSVGRWLPAARAAIAEAQERGRVPIVVGGTGLYFEALTRGLADVPAIPEPIRAGVRARLAEEGADALHAELARRDPGLAAKLRPSDPQRISRALEVLEATGKSLESFHLSPQSPELGGFRQVKIVLNPDRGTLYAAINSRLTAMIAGGALAEVEALRALGLPATLPAMRALGVAPLIAHLEGRLSLAAAAEMAQTASRHYAKRQLTWFRNKMIAWNWLDEQFSERNVETIFSLMTNMG